MNRLREIVAYLILGRDLLRSRGLEEHALALDAKAGSLIASLISRATNSDTERTVTARKPSNGTMRQLRRKHQPPKRKRWKCCRPLERRHSRHGTVWGTVCKYTMLQGKLAGQARAMWRNVSFGDKKPDHVIINGHKMSTCSRSKS